MMSREKVIKMINSSQSFHYLYIYYSFYRFYSFLNLLGGTNNRFLRTDFHPASGKNPHHSHIAVQERAGAVGRWS
jgi:hypothetical protein